MIEITIWMAGLSLGAVLICVNVFVFPTATAIWWIGLVVALISASLLGQSLLGLAISATIGMDGYVFVIILAIFGFVLWQGYALLTGDAGPSQGR